MKKLSTVFTTLVMLLAISVNALSAPPIAAKSGLKVIPDPAGNWEEIFYGGGPGQEDNWIHAWKIGWYDFEATLAHHEYALDDPLWEHRTTYTDGTLTLFNNPEAPWYNKKDETFGPFVYEDITVINLTNNDGTNLAFFLVGYFQGQAILSGSYAGPLQVSAAGIYGDLDMATIKAVPLHRNKKK